MVSFKFILLAITAATTALAFPLDVLEARNDGNATAALKRCQNTANSGSKYSVTWRNTGNFVGEKGWNPGTGRTINYGGSFKPLSNGYLAVYGWTRNPLVEYYVIESYGTYNPSSGSQRKGSVYTDGGNHDVSISTRTNQPSIDGISTFNQYYVNMQNHFNAWAGYGMRLGTHCYQIAATEGHQSSGSSEIYDTDQMKAW
ncbi:glycoside hydrolase [Setomelanomma holmii]|uniref:Endo-1,4-beta-xylanase n=1 Tax=Setomelanomma holmii TaxID=210430 RepID=A0A9P4HIS9_9PLEO|nr:glycoside hydrolase [Setomelanomma holmii]